MGNPRPTRSKPCKIGRKHTGEPRAKAKSKRAKGKAHWARALHLKARKARKAVWDRINKEIQK